MADEKKEMDFESSLKKLEEIVSNLESGDLSLDAALKQYEEGVRLADACSKRLTEAEKRVEVLIKSAGNRLKAAPFEGSSQPAPEKPAQPVPQNANKEGRRDHGRRRRR